MKTKSTIDPRRALAELEERVRDGDASVTATALAQARHAAELADLHDEAARRKAEREERDRREAEVNAFRQELDKARRDLSSLGETYGGLVTALRRLNEQIDKWKDQRRSLIARGKSIGLRDEADDLPTLKRDWLALASDEARGRYLKSERVFPGTSIHPPVHHELRTKADRERIDAEAQQMAEARTARLIAMNEEVRREREEEKRRILALANERRGPTGGDAA